MTLLSPRSATEEALDAGERLLVALLDALEPEDDGYDPRYDLREGVAEEQADRDLNRLGAIAYALRTGMPVTKWVSAAKNPNEQERVLRAARQFSDATRMLLADFDAGRLPAEDFTNALRVAFERQSRNAFLAGKRALGNLMSLTPDDEASIQSVIAAQGLGSPAPPPGSLGQFVGSMVAASAGTTPKEKEAARRFRERVDANLRDRVQTFFAMGEEKARAKIVWALRQNVRHASAVLDAAESKRRKKAEVELRRAEALRREQLIRLAKTISRRADAQDKAMQSAQARLNAAMSRARRNVLAGKSDRAAAAALVMGALADESRNAHNAGWGMVSTPNLDELVADYEEMVADDELGPDDEAEPEETADWDAVYDDALGAADSSLAASFPEVVGGLTMTALITAMILDPTNLIDPDVYHFLKRQLGFSEDTMHALAAKGEQAAFKIGSASTIAARAIDTSALKGPAAIAAQATRAVTAGGGGAGTIFGMATPLEEASLVWWVMGVADHCIDCRRLSDMSPFRLAEFSLNGIHPGSGHTRCGGNCRCHLEYEVPEEVCADAITDDVYGDIAEAGVFAPPSLATVYLQEARTCRHPIRVDSFGDDPEFSAVDSDEAFDWEDDIEDAITEVEPMVPLAIARTLPRLAKPVARLRWLTEPSKSTRMVRVMDGPPVRATPSSLRVGVLGGPGASRYTYLAEETDNALTLHWGATFDGAQGFDADFTLRAIHDLARQAAARGIGFRVNADLANPGLRRWFEELGLVIPPPDPMGGPAYYTWQDDLAVWRDHMLTPMPGLADDTFPSDGFAWGDPYTPEQIGVIKRWVRDGQDSMINSYLRTGMRDFVGATEGLRANMRREAALLASAARPLPGKRVLHRGTTPGAFGYDETFDPLVDDREIRALLDDIADDPYRDPGFMALTDSRAIAEDKGSIRWHITVPEGTPVIDVRDLGGYASKDGHEYILPPGSALRITGYRSDVTDSGSLVFDVNAVVEPKALAMADEVPSSATLRIEVDTPKQNAARALLDSVAGDDEPSVNWVNNYLRTGDLGGGTKAEMDAYIGAFDAISASSKASAAGVVWRGTSDRGWKVGDVWHDPGYMFATADEDWARHYGGGPNDVLLKLDVPVGTPLTQDMGEDVVFARAIDWRVVDITTVDGVKVVHMRPQQFAMADDALTSKIAAKVAPSSPLTPVDHPGYQQYVTNADAVVQQGFRYSKSKAEAIGRLMSVFPALDRKALISEGWLDPFSMEQIDSLVARGLYLQMLGVDRRLVRAIKALPTDSTLAGETVRETGTILIKPNPGLAGVKTTANSIGDVFAHEYAHLIDGRVAKFAASKRMDDLWAKVSANPDSVTATVSTYGATREEWFAEAVQLITRPDYVPGSLPYDSDILLAMKESGLFAVPAPAPVVTKAVTPPPSGYDPSGGFWHDTGPKPTVSPWLPKVKTDPHSLTVPFTGDTFHVAKGPVAPITAAPPSEMTWAIPDPLAKLLARDVRDSKTFTDATLATLSKGTQEKVLYRGITVLDAAMPHEGDLLTGAVIGAGSLDPRVAIGAAAIDWKAGAGTTPIVYRVALPHGDIRPDGAYRVVNAWDTVLTHEGKPYPIYVVDVVPESTLVSKPGDVAVGVPVAPPPPPELIHIPGSDLPLNAPLVPFSGSIPFTDPPLPKGTMLPGDYQAVKAAAEAAEHRWQDVQSGRFRVVLSPTPADDKAAVAAGLHTEKVGSEYFISRTAADLDPIKAFIAAGGDLDSDQFWYGLLGYKQAELEAIDAFAALKKGSASMRAGVLVVEPDGRLWFLEPRNHYGGYEHTWSKGGPDVGETLPQAATREVREEMGLSVEIDGVLGDYYNDTGSSVTRYYIGHRTGGGPAFASTKETYAIKLGTPAQIRPVLIVNGHPSKRDVAVLDDYLALTGQPPLAPAAPPIVATADQAGALADKLEPPKSSLALPDRLTDDVVRPSPSTFSTNPKLTDDPTFASAFNVDKATMNAVLITSVDPGMAKGKGSLFVNLQPKGTSVVSWVKRSDEEAIRLDEIVWGAGMSDAQRLAAILMVVAKTGDVIKAGGGVKALRVSKLVADSVPGFTDVLAAAGAKLSSGKVPRWNMSAQQAMALTDSILKDTPLTQAVGAVPVPPQAVAGAVPAPIHVSAQFPGIELAKVAQATISPGGQFGKWVSYDITGGLLSTPKFSYLPAANDVVTVPAGHVLLGGIGGTSIGASGVAPNATITAIALRRIAQDFDAHPEWTTLDLHNVGKSDPILQALADGPPGTPDVISWGSISRARLLEFRDKLNAELIFANAVTPPAAAVVPDVVPDFGYGIPIKTVAMMQPGAGFEPSLAPIGYPQQVGVYAKSKHGPVEFTIWNTETKNLFVIDAKQTDAVGTDSAAFTSLILTLGVELDSDAAHMAIKFSDNVLSLFPLPMRQMLVDAGAHPSKDGAALVLGRKNALKLRDKIAAAMPTATSAPGGYATPPTAPVPSVTVAGYAYTDFDTAKLDYGSGVLTYDQLGQVASGLGVPNTVASPADHLAQAAAALAAAPTAATPPIPVLPVATKFEDQFLHDHDLLISMYSTGPDGGPPGAFASPGGTVSVKTSTGGVVGSYDFMTQGDLIRLSGYAPNPNATPALQNDLLLQAINDVVEAPEGVFTKLVIDKQTLAKMPAATEALILTAGGVKSSTGWLSVELDPLRIVMGNYILANKALPPSVMVSVAPTVVVPLTADFAVPSAVPGPGAVPAAVPGAPDDFAAGWGIDPQAVSEWKLGAANDAFIGNKGSITFLSTGTPSQYGATFDWVKRSDDHAYRLDKALWTATDPADRKAVTLAAISSVADQIEAAGMAYDLRIAPEIVNDAGIKDMLLALGAMPPGGTAKRWRLTAQQAVSLRDHAKAVSAAAPSPGAAVPTPAPIAAPAAPVAPVAPSAPPAPTFTSTHGIDADAYLYTDVEDLSLHPDVNLFGNSGTLTAGPNNVQSTYGAFKWVKRSDDHAYRIDSVVWDPYATQGMKQAAALKVIAHIADRIEAENMVYSLRIADDVAVTADIDKILLAVGALPPGGTAKRWRLTPEQAVALRDALKPGAAAAAAAAPLPVGPATPVGVSAMVAKYPQGLQPGSQAVGSDINNIYISLNPGYGTTGFQLYAPADVTQIMAGTPHVGDEIGVAAMIGTKYHLVAGDVPTVSDSIVAMSPSLKAAIVKYGGVKAHDPLINADVWHVHQPDAVISELESTFLTVVPAAAPVPPPAPAWVAQFGISKTAVEAVAANNPALPMMMGNKGQFTIEGNAFDWVKRSDDTAYRLDKVAWTSSLSARGPVMLAAISHVADDIIAGGNVYGLRIHQDLINAVPELEAVLKAAGATPPTGSLKRWKLTPDQAVALRAAILHDTPIGGATPAPAAAPAAVASVGLPSGTSLTDQYDYDPVLYKALTSDDVPKPGGPATGTATVSSAASYVIWYDWEKTANGVLYLKDLTKGGGSAAAVKSAVGQMLLDAHMLLMQSGGGLVVTKAVMDKVPGLKAVLESVGAKPHLSGLVLTDNQLAKITYALNINSPLPTGVAPVAAGTVAPAPTPAPATGFAGLPITPVSGKPSNYGYSYSEFTAAVTAGGPGVSAGSGTATVAISGAVLTYDWVSDGSQVVITAIHTVSGASVAKIKAAAAQILWDLKTVYPANGAIITKPVLDALPSFDGLVVAGGGVAHPNGLLLSDSALQNTLGSALLNNSPLPAGATGVVAGSTPWTAAPASSPVPALLSAMKAAGPFAASQTPSGAFKYTYNGLAITGTSGPQGYLLKTATQGAGAPMAADVLDAHIVASVLYAIDSMTPSQNAMWIKAHIVDQSPTLKAALTGLSVYPVNDSYVLNASGAPWALQAKLNQMVGTGAAAAPSPTVPAGAIAHMVDLMKADGVYPNPGSGPYTYTFGDTHITGTSAGSGMTINSFTSAVTDPVGVDTLIAAATVHAIDAFDSGQTVLKVTKEVVDKSPSLKAALVAAGVTPAPSGDWYVMTPTTLKPHLLSVAPSAPDPAVAKQAIETNIYVDAAQLASGGLPSTGGVMKPGAVPGPGEWNGHIGFGKKHGLASTVKVLVRADTTTIYPPTLPKPSLPVLRLGQIVGLGGGWQPQVNGIRVEAVRRLAYSAATDAKWGGMLLPSDWITSTGYDNMGIMLGPAGEQIKAAALAAGGADFKALGSGANTIFLDKRAAKRLYDYLDANTIPADAPGPWTPGGAVAPAPTGSVAGLPDGAHLSDQWAFDATAYKSFLQSSVSPSDAQTMTISYSGTPVAEYTFIEPGPGAVTITSFKMLDPNATPQMVGAAAAQMIWDSKLKVSSAMGGADTLLVTQPVLDAVPGFASVLVAAKAIPTASGLKMSYGEIYPLTDTFYNNSPLPSHVSGPAVATPGAPAAYLSDQWGYDQMLYNGLQPEPLAGASMPNGTGWLAGVVGVKSTTGGQTIAKYEWKITTLAGAPPAVHIYNLVLQPGFTPAQYKAAVAQAIFDAKQTTLPVLIDPSATNMSEVDGLKSVLLSVGGKDTISGVFLTPGQTSALTDAFMNNTPLPGLGAAAAAVPTVAAPSPLPVIAPTGLTAHVAVGIPNATPYYYVAVNPQKTSIHFQHKTYSDVKADIDIEVATGWPKVTITGISKVQSVPYGALLFEMAPSLASVIPAGYELHIASSVWSLLPSKAKDFINAFHPVALATGGVALSNDDTLKMLAHLVNDIGPLPAGAIPASVALPTITPTGVTIAGALGTSDNPITYFNPPVVAADKLSISTAHKQYSGSTGTLSLILSQGTPSDLPSVLVYNFTIGGNASAPSVFVALLPALPQTMPVGAELHIGAPVWTSLAPQVQKLLNDFGASPLPGGGVTFTYQQALAMAAHINSGIAPVPMGKPTLASLFGTSQGKIDAAKQVWLAQPTWSGGDMDVVVGGIAAVAHVNPAIPEMLSSIGGPMSANNAGTLLLWLKAKSAGTMGVVIMPPALASLSDTMIAGLKQAGGVVSPDGSLKLSKADLDTLVAKLTAEFAPQPSAGSSLIDNLFSGNVVSLDQAKAMWAATPVASPPLGNVTWSVGGIGTVVASPSSGYPSVLKSVTKQNVTMAPDMTDAATLAWLKYQASLGTGASLSPGVTLNLSQQTQTALLQAASEAFPDGTMIFKADALNALVAKLSSKFGVAAPPPGVVVTPSPAAAIPTTPNQKNLHGAVFDANKVQTILAAPPTTTAVGTGQSYEVVWANGTKHVWKNQSYKFIWSQSHGGYGVAEGVASLSHMLDAFLTPPTGTWHYSYDFVVNKSVLKDYPMLETILNGAGAIPQSNGSLILTKANAQALANDLKALLAPPPPAMSASFGYKPDQLKVLIAGVPGQTNPLFADWNQMSATAKVTGNVVTWQTLKVNSGYLPYEEKYSVALAQLVSLYDNVFAKHPKYHTLTINTAVVKAVPSWSKAKGPMGGFYEMLIAAGAHPVSVGSKTVKISAADLKVLVSGLKNDSVPTSGGFALAPGFGAPASTPPVHSTYVPPSAYTPPPSAHAPPGPVTPAAYVPKPPKPKPADMPPFVDPNEPWAAVVPAGSLAARPPKPTIPANLSISAKQGYDPGDMDTMLTLGSSDAQTGGTAAQLAQGGTGNATESKWIIPQDPGQTTSPVATASWVTTPSGNTIVWREWTEVGTTPEQRKAAAFATLQKLADQVATSTGSMSHVAVLQPVLDANPELRQLLIDAGAVPPKLWSSSHAGQPSAFGKAYGTGDALQIDKAQAKAIADAIKADTFDPGLQAQIAAVSQPPAINPLPPGVAENQPFGRLHAPANSLSLAGAEKISAEGLRARSTWAQGKVISEWHKSDVSISWKMLGAAPGSAPTKATMYAVAAQQLRGMLDNLGAVPGMALDVDADVWGAVPELRDVLLHYGGRESITPTHHFIRLNASEAATLRIEMQNELAEMWGTVATNDVVPFVMWPAPQDLTPKVHTNLHGDTPKSIYLDPDGHEWLFKPGASGRGAKADEAASELAGLLGLRVPRIKEYVLKDTHGNLVPGSLQQMVPSTDVVASISALTPTQQAEVMKHQVLDWLVGNDDSHIENFLVVAGDPNVLWGIDKTRAFKGFKTQWLDPSSNARGGPSFPPLANLFWRDFKNNPALLSAISPKDMTRLLRRFDQLPDSTFERIFRPIARDWENYPWATSEDDLMKQLLARRRELVQDFSRLYQQQIAAVINGPKGAQLPQEWRDWYAKGAVFDLAATPNDLNIELMHELDLEFGPVYNQTIADQIQSQSIFDSAHGTLVSYTGSGLGGTGYGSDRISKQTAKASYEKMSRYNQWALLHLILDPNATGHGQATLKRAYDPDTGMLRLVRGIRRSRLSTPAQYYARQQRDGLRDCLSFSIMDEGGFAGVGDGPFQFTAEIPLANVYAAWLTTRGFLTGENEVLVRDLRVDQVVRVSRGPNVSNGFSWKREYAKLVNAAGASNPDKIWEYIRNWHGPVADP